MYKMQNEMRRIFASSYIANPGVGEARLYCRGPYKAVTGQLADKRNARGQSSRRLVNSRTSELAEMFDLKFGVGYIML